MSAREILAITGIPVHKTGTPGGVPVPGVSWGKRVPVQRLYQMPEYQTPVQGQGILKLCGPRESIRQRWIRNEEIIDIG
jgi:hypothetical protein